MSSSINNGGGVRNAKRMSSEEEEEDDDEVVVANKKTRMIPEPRVKETKEQPANLTSGVGETEGVTMTIKKDEGDQGAGDGADDGNKVSTEENKSKQDRDYDGSNPEKKEKNDGYNIGHAIPSSRLSGEKSAECDGQGKS